MAAEARKRYSLAAWNSAAELNDEIWLLVTVYVSLELTNVGYDAYIRWLAVVAEDEVEVLVSRGGHVGIDIMQVNGIPRAQ